MFYIGLYKEHMNKMVLSETTRPRALVLYIVSPSGPLPRCPNYAHVAKMAPPMGSHVLYRLNIWYVASSSGPLPSLFKLCSWCQKWARPGGHMFYIGLFKERMNKMVLSETTRPRALVYFVYSIT